MWSRDEHNCEGHVRITSTGYLKVLSEIPQVTFNLGGTANPLFADGVGDLAFRCGDKPGVRRRLGTPIWFGPATQLAKPGQSTVSLRVGRHGRLSELRGDVVISRSHADRLIPPVTALPTLTCDETGTGIPDGHTRVVGTVNAPAADPVIAHWRVGDQGGLKGNRATFDLKPGDYTLFFTAVRLLKARVYCTQRSLTRPVFDVNGLSLASNRRFDLNATETTGVGDNPPANPVATHLFAEGALSPVDEWTVELPFSDNACLRSVGATDAYQYGLAEIQDVVRVLEYESTPGSSSVPDGAQVDRDAHPVTSG